MVIQDLVPSLGDKKLTDFMSNLGPQLTDIEVSLHALTFALKKANRRIASICEVAFGEGLEEEEEVLAASDSFPQQFDILERRLNILLEKLIKASPAAFKKFTEEEEEKKEEGAKEEEGKEEETKEEAKAKGKAQKKEKKKFKEVPFGKGTSQLIDYIGKHILKEERFGAAALEVIAEKTNPSMNREFKDLLGEMVSQHNQERRRPKIPKGSRDMEPFQMRIK